MNIFDVVYTPLDTPKMPEVDVEKLLKWIDESHPKLSNHNNILNNTNSIAEKKYGDAYPWKLTPVYFNGNFLKTGWLNNFDKIFPDLSVYFYTAFGLTLDDIGGIVLLPTLLSHTGIGFWHQDVDKLGLRMYLEFDDFDNALLVRKTKVKYIEKLDHNDELLGDALQEEILNCKIMNKNQCFFLNNVNAAHTIYTAVAGKKRIAVLFTERNSNQNELLSKIEPLVVNSAKKFSDYSIIW